MTNNDLIEKMESLRKAVDGALSLLRAGMVITDESLKSEPGVLLLGQWRISPRFHDEKPENGNGVGGQVRSVHPPLGAEARSLVPDARQAGMDALREHLNESGIQRLVEAQPASSSTPRNRRRPGA